MDKITKPEKKSHSTVLSVNQYGKLKEHRPVNDWVKYGYNQACDEWQKYHNHILSKVADEERLIKIINDYITPKDIAKAIAKMIRGEV